MALSTSFYGLVYMAMINETSIDMDRALLLMNQYERLIDERY